MTSVLCLRIPTSVGTLVVPAAMVAEVLPFPDELFPLPGVYPWVEGFFYWRNYPVTLVSFERLAADPDVSGYQSICVFFPLPTRDKHDFFALASVGEPGTLLIHQTATADTPPVQLSRRFVAAAVKHNESTLILPDFESLKLAFYPGD